jgi:hypothetical protein
VLVESQDAAADQLIQAGWNYDTYGDSFRSSQAGEVNLILCTQFCFDLTNTLRLLCVSLRLSPSDKAFQVALYDLVKRANRIKMN